VNRGRACIVFGFWIVLGAAWTTPLCAQAFDTDAGDDEDAGVTDAGPVASPGTLPPVETPPRIAPIVNEPHVAPPKDVPVATADRPVVLIKTILGLFGLIALAYLGGHPRVLALERRLGISQVITAGFPFVLLGWFVRTPTVGLLNDHLLRELGPILRVGLGAIGFVAGFRFSLQLRPSPEIIRTAAFATAVPFVFVALSSGLLLLWMSGDVSSAAIRDPVFLRDALILGTAGAMTARSSTGVFRADDARGVLGRVLRLEELAGIIGVALIAAYFRPLVGVSWQLPGTAWLLLTLGLGFTLGLIAYFILNRSHEGPEFALLTLGLIAFCAGTAGYLRLSPIAIAFIAGACLLLLPELSRQRMREALSRLERPIYLLSLIVIGALWQIDDWRGWALVPVFTGARFFGKWAGIELGARLSGQALTPEQKQVLTIAPIGPLAVAIVVNAQLLYPGGSISPIVASVIVGGVLTEVVVQYVSRRATNSADSVRRGSA